MTSKAGDVDKEGSRDLRQKKLVTEDKSNGQRVSFRLEETEKVSRSNSDHMPLVLEMNRRRVKKNKVMEKEEDREIYRWREKDIMVYKERTEEINDEEEAIVEESIEEKWKVLKELVLKSMRKRKLNRERYIEERRKLREHLEEKKKRWKEKEEEELRNLKYKAQVWKVINRKRGKGNWIKNEITKEE
ncbi:coiled-coil domain-containing protein 34-like [Solenopsis invicta]|uniref:coiled-coil domain-containing protein 34-like n=1 Tax=Solenopsis invicta TaxID=13686 RepID=UPI000595FB52|nr:coiled-coil domain-containing protein 34-like [Solenopsis invicta]